MINTIPGPVTFRLQKANGNKLTIDDAITGTNQPFHGVFDAVSMGLLRPPAEFDRSSSDPSLQIQLRELP